MLPQLEASDGEADDTDDTDDTDDGSGGSDGSGEDVDDNADNADNAIGTSAENGMEVGGDELDDAHGSNVCEEDEADICDNHDDEHDMPLQGEHSPASVEPQSPVSNEDLEDSFHSCSGALRTPSQPLRPHFAINGALFDSPASFIMSPVARIDMTQPEQEPEPVDADVLGNDDELSFSSGRMVVESCSQADGSNQLVCLQHTQEVSFALLICQQYAHDSVRDVEPSGHTVRLYPFIKRPSPVCCFPPCYQV
jgi:hypothetical protein